MKQVFNKKGKVVVDDVPVPVIGDDELLVQVYYSCISSGTEVSVLKSHEKSLVKKALEKPQNVKKVFDMLREKGLGDSITRIKKKIDSKDPIGYSASGLVIKTGRNIYDIKPGDFVACAGAGISNHAEFIAVPENLAVRVPEGLSLMPASTIALGAIALQGVRRCAPEIGYNVVVFGLGILGQITTQLLGLSGCRVIGIDIDENRIGKAKSLGLFKGINSGNKDAVKEVMLNTDGFGADAVIITAASKSEMLINQSIEMCRRKGRVVIVGDIAININREEFYKKELDVLISTSYGPGRYDDNYEIRGLEYPYEYIRWTEKRNMQEYLRSLAEKKLDIGALIDRTFPVESAPDAYEYIKSDKKPLIVLLEYNQESKPETEIIFRHEAGNKEKKINVGIIGAGSFTQETHLPNLEKLKEIYNIYSICSKVSGEAESLAGQYKAVVATTDYLKLLKDKNIRMVMITTRHNLHAKIAIESLEAGKAVFVEKPMAIKEDELLKLQETIEKTKLPFMVGFNRRFSPHMRLIKQMLGDSVGPIIINYRMNAGFIQRDHWVHTEEGGGRNIGEACHIYDIFNFLTDSKMHSVEAYSISPISGQFLSSDNFSAMIKYKDGSVCNLIYTAMGASAFPKEQMDIYYDGKTIQLNDFREVYLYDNGAKLIDRSGQDKGHYNELKSLGDYLLGNDRAGIIPLWQLVQATRISFEVEKQIRES